MATCKVTGTVLNLDGSPCAEAQVTACIKSTGDDGGQVLESTGVASSQVAAFTDEDGAFEIELLQGARVMLEIPNIKLRKLVDIPDEDTADFIDLI